MSMPDDSALLHGRLYDPQKAREYYLRTRKLKGRRAGSAEVPASQRSRGPAASPANPKTRRAQLEAQKAILEKRLDRLRDILAQKVEAAKARSGVKNEPADKADAPAEKAAKNEANKKDSPLTAKQKQVKAEKAREEYKKENRENPPLSDEVAQLQRQIVDIRAKIQAAVKDAREKSAQSNPKTASNGR